MFRRRAILIKYLQCNCIKLHTSNIKQQDNLQPVKLSYASYENTKTHTGDVSSPVVVMHGLFGSKANWNSLCKAMHQKTIPQRKIIAIDARNHGDSPHSNEHTYQHLTEDVKQLYKQLKIKKSILLGHSMGGRTVMYFALKYPELVEKLIIADMSPISSGTSLKSMPNVFKALNSISLPSNVPMSAARLSADLQLSKSINDKGLRSFLLTNLVEKSDGSYTWRINLPVLIKNFENHIAVFPNTNGLLYKGPTLFVGGGASDFIQKTDHAKIKNLFPNSEFEYIEGAGHWLHSEKPTEFLKIVLEFLNRKTTVS